MKFVKMAKKALIYPILGVFLITLFSGPIKAMSHHFDAITEDVTDDETKAYLPEIQEKKAVNDAIGEFRCPYKGCRFKTEKPGYLKYHLLMTPAHHDEWPLVCPFKNCKFAVPARGELNKHIESKHF